MPGAFTHFATFSLPGGAFNLPNVPLVPVVQLNLQVAAGGITFYLHAVGEVEEKEDI